MSGKQYEYEFRLEMRTGQDMRHVNADSRAESDGWLIFCRKPPQGGAALEYWRVRLDDVVSMETLR